MSKILVHFPIVLSFLAALFFTALAFLASLWLLIPAWQALCITIMLILDGKNRMKRYRKMTGLIKKGVSPESLPRERTICGFFIRAAVLYETIPVRAG